MFRLVYSISPAILLIALQGCASTQDEGTSAISLMREQHEADLAALEREQRRLASSGGTQQTLEFGPLGDLLVKSVELVGWPGAAKLHADFTWINTGTRTRRPPIVQLSIIDQAGGERRSVVFPLGVTLGIEYGNGSTYSAWLELPTDGLYLRPGWSWKLELLAHEQEEHGFSHSPSRSSVGPHGETAPRR